MKKLFPLACATLLLAACADGNWGYCEQGCCGNAREALSQRSLGSMRGIHNAPLQYNDQDYRGSKHEDCDKMHHTDKKVMKKKMHKASAAPAAGSPAPQKEQPRKRGLFF
jgi:hypothetical protein